ncbi:MAG TPA: type II toxin-antitoxin system prevent-host-death family antitoxin [Burkholderiales bacterium]|nr:type II toxin-antitoxin system prevent-host-death family antitoxin [Burkholderiales bacterium]
MKDVNISELRQNLPAFIEQVRKGKELRITVRGKVVAKIVPEHEDREAARAFLASLRGKCKIGDIISPLDVEWDAERDPS